MSPSSNLTLTFLLTDIEGSTSLLLQMGEAYARLLEGHHQLIRRTVADHSGQEIATEGDSFVIAFERALDAVATAAIVQRSLAEEARSGHAVKVRMGIHTGEVQSGPTGYVGMALHQGARIRAAAHGGQVLISEATRLLLADTLPTDLSLRDLGTHRLKDLIRPEILYQLCGPDIPDSFPAPRSMRKVNTSLPAQPTPFIGRERLLKEFQQLIDGGSTRLITFIGPGGVGKTRLASEGAAMVVDRFPDGIFYIPLASVVDPDALPAAVAEGLDLRQIANARLQLNQYLSERRLLMVLDNFEHLIAAGPFVAELLAACPMVVVVVTSREALRLRGEREFPVPEMEIPVADDPLSAEDLRRFESLVLFEERAKDVRPDFRLTEENASSVAEICRRLDGLPLAIELAASRMKIFGLRALLGRLENRLELLTSGQVDRPTRHRTLFATIEWSYELLDEPEKRLFRRLSVFSGGWSLEAAEAVCALPAASLLDTTFALVNKSLIRTEEQPSGEPRFSMLGTVREFALNRSSLEGEERAMRQAHSAYFIAAVEEAEADLTSARRDARLEELGVEKDNVRSVLRWVLDRDDRKTAVRMTAALVWYWYHSGQFTEGRRWLDEAIGRAGAEEGDRRALATGLTGAARLARYQFDLEAARGLADRAVDFARQSTDRRTLGYALQVLALVLQEQNDGDAIGAIQESVELFRRTDDRWGLAFTTFYLGVFSFYLGQDDLSIPALEEGEAIFSELGDLWGIAGSRMEFGFLMKRRREFHVAKVALEEAVELLREVGDKWRLAFCLTQLADVHERLGSNADAFWAEVKALQRDLGVTEDPKVIFRIPE